MGNAKEARYLLNTSTILQLLSLLFSEIYKNIECHVKICIEIMKF